MPSHRHLTAPIDRQILIAYEKLKNNSDRQAHSNLCQMILATPPPNHSLNCHEEDSDDENFEIKWIEKNGMDFETVFEMYSKLHRGANPKEEQSIKMTQEMHKYDEVRKIANSLVLLAFANEESKLEDLKVTIGYGKVKFRLKMDGGKEKTEKTSESKGKTSENKDKLCEYWRGIGGTWTWYQEIVTDENGTRLICDVRFVKDQKYQDLAASEFLSIFKHPTTKQNRISFNTLEVDYEEYTGWDPKAYPFDTFFEKLELEKPLLKVSKFIMKTYRKKSAEPQHLLRMLELLDPEGLEESEESKKSKKSKAKKNPEEPEESGIDRIVLKLWNGSHLETGDEPKLDFTEVAKTKAFEKARKLFAEHSQFQFKDSMSKLMTFGYVALEQLSQAEFDEFLQIANSKPACNGMAIKFQQKSCEIQIWGSNSIINDPNDKKSDQNLSTLTLKFSEAKYEATYGKRDWGLLPGYDSTELGLDDFARTHKWTPEEVKAEIGSDLFDTVAAARSPIHHIYSKK
ncbi:unnamed protein product [Caenorhabditis nigoni]